MAIDSALFGGPVLEELGQGHTERQPTPAANPTPGQNNPARAIQGGAELYRAAPPRRRPAYPMSSAMMMTMLGRESATGSASRSVGMNMFVWIGRVRRLHRMPHPGS